jgi:hypothetical protein
LLAIRFHPGLDPTRAYEGTDTRAFEPLVGAALALLVTGWPRRSPRQEGVVWAAGLAAFGVLGAWSVTAGGPPDWMYRGGMFVAALLAAVVIVSVAGSRPGPLGRLLSVPPLRYVGRISYGLYLWHWPVYLVAGDTGLSGAALDLCRVGLTVALAVASYHLVEQPVRRSPRVVRPAWLAVGGATATAVLVATAALPGLASASGSVQAPTAAVRPVAPPPSAGTTPSLVAVAAPAPARPASVVVVGDSTAMTLAAGLAARQAPLGLVVHNSGGLGCSVVGNFTADDVYGPRRLDAPLPACDWTVGWPTMLERYRPQVVVMLFGPWDTADHLVDGRWLLVGTPSWLAYYETRLNQMVNLLSSRGAVVVLATAPHYHHQPSPGEPAPRFSDPARVDALNRAYRAFAASHPAVVLDDLSSLVTLSDLVDGVHFSPAGGQRIAAILGPELARLATGRQVR